MITWIIEPNSLAWVLFVIASISLLAIAIRMWINPKQNISNAHRSVKCTDRNRFKSGELYKMLILTIWLVFNCWLMYEVYRNSFSIYKDHTLSDLISIIGIIVATLIGWQIYSVMDWNSKIERLSKIEDNNITIDREIKDTRAYTEASILFIKALNMIADIGENGEERKDEYEDIYQDLLKALSLYSGPTLEETIEACINNLQLALNSLQMYRVEVSPIFMENCDALYETIKQRKDNLTKAQWNKLIILNTKRKSIKIASTTD